MGVTLVILLGSVGSGKTTTARALTGFLQSKKNISAYYVDITVFHGLAYLVVATLSHIIQRFRGCRYVGNHYLTLWFNNRDLLSRVYSISLFLDILSLALTVVIRVYLKVFLCILLGKKCVIFIDEGPLTATAIHYYFSKQFNTTTLFKYYYRVATALSFKLAKSWETLFVILEQPLKSSIEAWFKREKTNIADIDMILVRFAVEYAVLKFLSESCKMQVLRLNAINIGSVASEIMRRILALSLSRTSI